MQDKITRRTVIYSKLCIQLSMLAFIAMSATSCISYESLVSYNEGEVINHNDSHTILNPRKITIQEGDVLEIKVHSRDLLTSAPFNLIPIGTGAVINNPNLYQLNGYLVSAEGLIDFPILGPLYVKGLSIEEAKMSILKELDEYLVDPVVNIRYINFKVTVSGEVNLPQSFTIYDQRITLPEAITMAGDFTSYANRRSILIVRETNDKRKFARVNMASSKFFDSEFYYLQQNDLIYVEPLEGKQGAVRDNSTKILPFVSAGVSILALIISAAK